jgi:hypothetical protein
MIVDPATKKIHAIYSVYETSSVRMTNRVIIFNYKVVVGLSEFCISMGFGIFN